MIHYTKGKFEKNPTVGISFGLFEGSWTLVFLMWKIQIMIWISDEK